VQLLYTVGENDSDPVAGAKPAVQKRVGEPVRALLELFKGDGTGALEDGGRLAELPGGAVDEVLNEHLRPVPSQPEK
jgi:hypothetical protein